MHSAIELDSTNTIPVQSTSTCAEKDEQGTEPLLTLGGFRKRWADKKAASSFGDSQHSDCLSEEVDEMNSKGQADFPFSQFDTPAPEIDLEVKDAAVDDLVEQAELMSQLKRQKTHDYEREALKSTDLKVFKYPWERGRLKRFFSDEPIVPVRVPSLKPGGRNFVGVTLEVDATGHVTAKASVKPAIADQAVFMSVVKKIDDMPVSDDRTLQRKKALEGWWSLLAFSLVSSSIGLKVTVEATADTVFECALKILDAVFAVKSPGTLMRRLYSIQAFEHWCNDKFNEHWLPVTEYKAWQYVCWLKDTSAAPTKATSFIEALRFSWYLLGVEGSGDAEKSLRVKGLASQQKASKKPWRPADLLRLDEVLQLHAILMDESAALGDRLLCGHFLHLLYGRCRWSDLTCVTDLFIDSDTQYLEVATRWHKGGRSAEMKARLLPIVAPARGVDQSNWAVEYLALRKRAGLELPLEEHGPMMRAPLNDAATQWSSRPLSSEEGSAFLRGVLKAPKTTTRRLSTHSMKSTILSWSSKYGLPDSTRAVLARHVSSVASATAVYSRDLLSPVLRELDNMLTAMRTGLFHPDRTRSGMITPVALAPMAPVTPFGRGMPPVPATPVHQVAPTIPAADRKADDQAEVLALGNSSLGSWEHVENLWNADDASVGASPSPADCGQADSDTSEEASVQSSSSSESEGEEEEPRHFNFDPPSDFYINNNSLVVHCCRTDGVLKCGRRVSPNFSKVFELNGIRCSRCFDV
eukprot:s526_g10.t1